MGKDSTLVKAETGPKSADSRLKCSLSGCRPCRWELVGGTCMSLVVTKLSFGWEPKKGPS